MLPVAHIAAPLFFLAVYDKYLKVKESRRVPGIYFILIGVAGILPDLLGMHIYSSGRATLSHSLLLPFVFLAAYLVLRRMKSKYSVYALLFLVGVSVHFVLDAVTAQMYPFYPFSTYSVGALLLIPAEIVEQNGTLYLDMWEHAAWYAFDVLFFAGFVIVEKTRAVERIFQ